MHLTSKLGSFQLAGFFENKKASGDMKVADVNYDLELNEVELQAITKSMLDLKIAAKEACVEILPLVQEFIVNISSAVRREMVNYHQIRHSQKMEARKLEEEILVSHREYETTHSR